MQLFPVNSICIVVLTIDSNLSVHDQIIMQREEVQELVDGQQS